MSSAEPYLSEPAHAIADAALDTIFRKARTLRKWQDKPVSDALLMAIYDLARMGPTEGNITPARFHFVVSKAAKVRLEPLLSEGNRKQTMAAPATAIIGYDLNFAASLAKLAPHNVGLAEKLAQDPERTKLMAMRSTGLQGGYFMIAARALGLDCGPMAGFDNAGIDAEFFAGTAIKSYFLCNLGYGDPEGLRPRAARLDFDEACRILVRLLAVDTALGACSVAVLDGGKILSHHIEEMARGHAEALAPMVEAAMREAKLSFAALDRLAVTTGPGTFTGQRVGLAFMRGLKVALKKPLIGVTTLEAMAVAALAMRRPEGVMGKAAAIHDAKRDEAYLLLWEKDQTVFAPAVMPFADAVEKIRGFGSCALAGTGAAQAHAGLGDDFVLTAIRQPDALFVARLAYHRPATDRPPAPLYLRAPDAKLPGGKSLGAA